MASVTRKDSETGFFHVMHRGVGKQILFEDESDYKFFLGKLETLKKEIPYELSAYCLMENHFHLLIYSSCKDMSKLMLRLSTSYAIYFNRKYDHAGHVFQGRYVHREINNQHYLEACIRYIHNNPLEIGCSRGAYRWSSYTQYFSALSFVDSGRILEILGGEERFREISEASDAKYGDCIFPGEISSNKMFEKGMTIIQKELGSNCHDGLEVKALDKKRRNKIIKDLKTIGMSHKKIEMLTGVSKSIIARI